MSNKVTQDDVEYERDKQELKKLWGELKDLVSVNPFPLLMAITLIIITIKLISSPSI